VDQKVASCLPRVSLGCTRAAGWLLIDAPSYSITQPSPTQAIHLFTSQHVCPPCILPCFTILTITGTYRAPPSKPRAVPGSLSTPASLAQGIFNAALEGYKRKTKKDLASHPLLPKFQSCDSPEAILTVLGGRIPAFSESQNGDDRLTKWVAPTVNVLYSFSTALGRDVNIGIFLVRNFCSNICFLGVLTSERNLRGN
jgi:hypothetical protein